VARRLTSENLLLANELTVLRVLELFFISKNSCMNSGGDAESNFFPVLEYELESGSNRFKGWSRSRKEW